MASLLPAIGHWRIANQAPAYTPTEIVVAVARVREPAHIVQDAATGAIGLAIGGTLDGDGSVRVLASLPALYPEWLGCRSFAEVHRLRFPYVTGAMANGIATTDVVIAIASAGGLGFFGAAGLPRPKVEAAIDRLQAALGDNHSWGCNLINSPNEPSLERSIADLYIQRGVKRVSAAAYMNLTPSIVRFALTGVRQNADGSIHRERYVFAKISRPEVVRHFLEPAPKKILDGLVAEGLLTPEEARLGAMLPVAEDIIVESDSGGHTDNRPLSALFPSICSVRDEVVATQGYTRPIRLGAAGGLGTPTALAAAFALGASFALTGTVNQACIESGLDHSGRKMLAKASIADVMMAPSADMFELGVEVQVLRRGTMFGPRAHKLYSLYKRYDCFEDVPADDRIAVEKMLKTTFEEGWQATRAFWMTREESQAVKGDTNLKHRMALVFRSYLGQSSRWAIAGVPDRMTDFQIWCGPAMGAFNDWTAGTFLADPDNRTIVQVARNLMEGAAVVTRAQQLRSYGLPVPSEAFTFQPRPLG
jgi:trans-AT polyketide synthase/acyltransferase/oxidoreductase domain-containing protein